MSRNLSFVATLGIGIILSLFVSCEIPPDNPGEPFTPESLFLNISEDTVLVLSGDEIALEVYGVYLNETQTTIRNSGVLAETSYVDYSLDTVQTLLDRRDVDWFSSAPSIVEISDGIVLGKNAGTAAVWAGMNDLTSDSLVLIVNTPDRAPDFLLDPPTYQLVFQNSGRVSGQTLVGQNITLIVGTDTTTIESNGRFSHWVPLMEGINPIPVTAVNNENGLSTTKQKTFVYYPLESSGIIGHWSGTTLTRPFSFDIYQSLGIYVIDGTMTVDVTMIGGPLIVRDIVVYGLILPDGTIDATLSKEWGGFTLTGHMEGYFRDSGHSQGTYGFRITRSGWPTVSASAAWTAEKD